MSRSSSSVESDLWRRMAEAEMTSSARLLFVHLATTSDIKWNGVTPLAPQRWAYLTGLPVRVVERAFAELVEARYVLADVGTAEVLVRVFRSWNGALGLPPSPSDLVIGVISPTIREELAGKSRRS